MNELVLREVSDAYASIAYGDQLARTAELAIVLGIAAACDLHRVDESSVVEGAERLVRGGAVGTPLVGEFVAGEIAALLGISPGSAFHRIGQVLNVRHRHPELWERFCAGRVWFWQAAQIADQCAAAGLDLQACHHVDRLCAVALQLQPWHRVRTRLAEWIVRADPARAADRAVRASARRHVTIEGIVEGHCDLWGRLEAADGVLLDQALDAVADTLPADVERDHRRAAALGVLARGVLGQAELPVTQPAADASASVTVPRLMRTAELVVHLTDTDVADPARGAATLDRWGGVPADQLAGLLQGCRVVVRPILDPTRLPASDAYQVPALLRLALTERNPVDVFPYGTTPARRCDADHTVAFDHQAPPGHGQTHLGNLGPLARYSHRLNTHGGWRLAQPTPGVYHWRSPAGYEYLVTTDGTIRIRRPDPPTHAWWRVEPPDEPDPGEIDLIDTEPPPPQPLWYTQLE